MAETNAILNLQGKDDGFAKILNSASDGFTNLSEVVGAGKDNLTKLRDESGLFEKTFKGLTGTLKRGQTAFDALGDQAGTIASSFTASAKITDVTNQGFVKIAASALGLGRQVGFVNTVLGPLGDLWHNVDDAQTGAGKGFAVLNAVSKPLIESLKSVSEFSADVADKLSGMGTAGTVAAKVFLGLSKALGSLGTGVKIADIAGDMFRLVEATKTFAEEQLPELIEQAKGAAEMFDKLGVKTMLFGDRLKTIRTIATVLSTVGKGVLKELSQMTIKLLDFREQAKMFAGMATAIQDAYLRLKGLNEGFETFQAMGVDTSMAQLAVQIGVVGEGLFTNAEAAKNFAKVTVTAFAQVEDKLAYLQTLSTAANEGTSKLFASMQSLASGPLKNTITTADAAKASYFAMSAGADTLAKSNMLMTATGKAAVAGQIDQAQAINAVTNAMAPMKINMRDTATVLGQFAATTELGQLDMGNLTGVIGELSSAAAAANIPLQQTLGIYAKLTQTGPPGEAATRLGNLLQDITNFSGPAQDELDRLGVRIDKYTIQQKGLLPVLQELYQKAGGNIQSLRKIFANDYSFQAFYSLMQDVEGAGKTVAQVSGAGAESLDKMFNTRRESTMMKATELMNGFRGVMEEFGQRMLPMLTPFIDFLSNMLERFEQMPEPMKQFIAASALAAIGIQKVTEVGGTFGGILFNLGKMYLMARVSSLLWSGQLLNEAKVLKDLVINQKDYGAALIRLFGIQQQGANVMTTVAEAQEAGAKAAALGKQAEDARFKAVGAQVAASQLQEKAEKLKAASVTLSAEADQAAAVASQLKADADAAGGTNARLNAQADDAATAAARSRALANEATAKASLAQAAADLKTVEATKANQVAKDTAHNADLANKNASIRASQAATAAEVQSSKLSQAAVVARTKASEATQTALALESVSAEKAAAATVVKSAADEAGGTNAILNSRATAAQTTAKSAQAAASSAATKAIELNTAATIAETKSTEAAALAQSTYAEAEVASAFATKKNTEAKVQNATVSLANDDAVQTIDLATGVVEANTVKVKENQAAKVNNAATALADDDTWQTLEVVNGAVEVNTATVTANTGATVTHATTTKADAAAEITNAGATVTNTEEKIKNTGATVVNTQARGLLGKINAFLTTDINLQNIAIFKNTMAMSTGAGATGFLAAATNVLTISLGAAKAAALAFWASLGPITVVLVGLYVAFNTFKEIGQMLNVIGSDFTEVAKTVNTTTEEISKMRREMGETKKEIETPIEKNKSWFQETLKYIGLTRDKTAEYTGFLNTVLFPLLNLASNLVSVPFKLAGDAIKGTLNLFTGGRADKAIDDLGKKAVSTGKAIVNALTFGKLEDEINSLDGSVNGFFRMVKDGAQEMMERPMREAFEKQDATIQALLLDAKKLEWQTGKGKLAGEEAQKLLNKARQDATSRGTTALKGEQFEEVLKKNRETVQAQTKINDEAVTKLTEQLNDPKLKKARKEQLQVQIDALKQESSALEENLNKQEKYLQNIQSIAGKIDENNKALSSDNTIENLKQQQKDLTAAFKDSPNEIKNRYNDLFESIKTGMNNTSAMQRRINNQLITAVKDFADNAKVAKDINSVEDLQKMQQDADTLRDRILQSFEAGAIGPELAKKLIGEIGDQEITVDAPNFKFKGKILSVEQQQQLIEAQTKINQELVERNVTQIQQGIEDINLAESKGELTQGQVQTSRLEQQIKIDALRLDNSKKTEQLMLDAYGEKSPQYIKAVQERRAAERAVEKDSYDKRQAQDDYYAERRIKNQERAIANIKSLVDRQRLTEGQGAIETLKREDQINNEEIARVKKRMTGMKDTSSDAYKDLQAQLAQLENNGQTKRFQVQRQKEDYALDRRVKVHETAILKIQAAEATFLKTQGQAAQDVLKQEIAINAERLKLARSRLEQIGKEAGTNSDVYKDQLREVTTLELDATTKRFQLQRQQEDYALDRRVKVHEEAIAKIQLSEQILLKTQGQAAQETLKQEIEINKERQKLARTRLADIGRRAGTNSDTYKDQLREVNALERESILKRFQLQRQQEDYALDRRVKVHEEAIAKIQLSEQILLKTQGQAAQETLRQEIEINKERQELARTRLADIGRRAGTNSDTYKDQLREVNALEREFILKRFQLQRQQEDYALDRRVKVHEEAIAEISLSEKLLQRTQFEAGQETLKQEIAINQERITLQRQRLEEVRSRAGENSDIFKDQERELRALQRTQIEKSFQLRAQEVVHELEVQQQRITNQVEAQNQAYKAQLNQIDIITNQMQLQAELAESRNSLLQTSSSGIQQQLETMGKLVSDERLNAQLQVASAQVRLEALGKTQQVEQDNLKRQEQTKKLALDRQKIELQSNKLANLRAILEENINFRRLQATQKVTAEQEEQHRLMLTNLQQQDEQYIAQEENLNEQIASQAELNQNALDELDIRQQQAKDGGVMDVMLAKQGQMTAQLDKEREMLEKRNELEKSRIDAYAGQLSILNQTTNSERKQRDIASAIAAIKLNSLAQQQQGEAQVLELQIKQRSSVLEQEKSRLRMLEAENKARIAEAKERVISAIAEGKSTEQIQARLDVLKGYAEASAGIKAAGMALDERGKYEAQMSQYERSGLVAKQVQDRQQAQLDLAQNMPMGLQRQMKGFIQGEVFNQLGVGWGDVQSMGRNTAYNTMAQGYDRRSAFSAITPLEAPKPVDYEALRKDALAQLNEFVLPKATAPAQQQAQTLQQNQQIQTMQKTIDAIAQRQPNQLDQKNTFNIILPAGTSDAQAKSLEEPLIKLQMNIWQGVKKELGL